MSKKLYITEYIVKKHISKFAKLNLKDRMQATIYIRNLILINIL